MHSVVIASVAVAISAKDIPWGSSVTQIATATLAMTTSILGEALFRHRERSRRDLSNERTLGKELDPDCDGYARNDDFKYSTLDSH